MHAMASHQSEKSTALQIKCENENYVATNIRRKAGKRPQKGRERCKRKGFKKGYQQAMNELHELERQPSQQA